MWRGCCQSTSVGPARSGFRSLKMARIGERVMEVNVNGCSRLACLLVMYLTAGYAVGLASKSSWEAFVQRRIFDPLGMSGANFSTIVAEKTPNRATPHRLETN